MSTQQDEIDEAREIVRKALLERAVLRGDFTLRSGQKSHYFLDCKRVTLHPVILALIGNLMYFRLRTTHIDAIGGVETGGIPLSMALALAIYANRDTPPEAGKQLAEKPEMFFVRKTPKDIGTRALVEGVLQPGDRVVLVEDVLTTGGSIKRAVDVVLAAGAHVHQIIALVDRQQGAQALLHPYTVSSLFTAKDLGL